jgi:hypothetical protein
MFKKNCLNFDFQMILMIIKYVKKYSYYNQKFSGTYKKRT